MRNLEELGINEGGMPVDRPPPSDQEITDFESYFGVKLPYEYLRLLCHSNGGHPKLDAFRPQSGAEDELWGVNRFYHLGGNKNDFDCLWRATTEWRTAIGKNIVPVANDSGGNQIVLTYDCYPPSILICVHDDEFRMIHVADSFAEFIDLLCEDPDMI